MKKLYALVLSLFVLFLSCDSVSAVKMKKVSPENLLQMQSYTYETNNVGLVTKSVIATLQDSDFIIEDMDILLGHIRARKTFKARYTNKKRVLGWSAVLVAAGAYTAFSYGAAAYSMYSPSRRVMAEMKDKTIVVDANVFIDRIDKNKVQVRFLPVEKILQNADGFSFVTSAPVRVIRIYDSKVYNEFFAQVEQNMRI